MPNLVVGRSLRVPTLASRSGRGDYLSARERSSLRAMLAAAIMAAAWVAPVSAYEVVVPETAYSALPVMFTAAATGLVDDDSVLVSYTELPGLPDLGTTSFQVININTGEVELPPVALPYGLRVVTVRALGPDLALIVVRDDNASSQGKYVVVNRATGAIERGPTEFSSIGTGYEYRVAVASPSTVLIAWRSDDGFKGAFTVIDPQSGSVKVPETIFDSLGINTADVVALDEDRVLLAYEHLSNDGYRSFFTVLDPNDGSTLLAPVEFEPSFGIPRVLKLDATDVLIFYSSEAGSSRFVRANTVTGAMGTPVTWGGANTWDFTVSPALLGDHLVFIPYWRSDAQQGFFVVHDIGGPALVPETSFNPDGATHYVSSVASGCRVFLSYQDAGDGEKGKFQVLDFADLCASPTCPGEVTDGLHIFRSPFGSIPFTPFRFQWVLVKNATSAPIPGPLAFVMDDLRNGVFLGSRLTTSCLSPGGDPYVVMGTGRDHVLRPGEFAVKFLLFLKTERKSIKFTARVLGGVPMQ